MGRGSHRRWGEGVALLLAAALAGCSGVGPTTQEVQSQSVASNNEARYEFVDIDAHVVDILRGRGVDSLRSTFGDYRGSVEPRIGVGDSVSVTIWEAGAGGLFSAGLTTDRFSTGSKSATIPDQAVGRDGAITVPYAGRIRVVGRSTAEVQQIIERSLEGKAIQPQVLVNITRPISSTATVTGEVTTGARVPLTMQGDRLLDVIATAGGVRVLVNEALVLLSRNGRTARVALSRVVSDPRENIYVRPGDVVTLVREPQTFIAYGATGRNAEIPFESDVVMLSQALAKAGGLLDNRADPAGVFVFRYEPDSISRRLRPDSSLIEPGRLTPVVYRLNLKDANSLFVAQNFRIFPRDVVYVSNAPSGDLQKALLLFNLVVSPAVSGANIYSRVTN